MLKRPFTFLAMASWRFWSVDKQRFVCICVAFICLPAVDVCWSRSLELGRRGFPGAETDHRRGQDILQTWWVKGSCGYSNRSLFPGKSEKTQMVYLNYGAKKEMKMRIKFLYFVEFHERSFPSIHLCTLQSTLAE